jgi:hypothetical protein
MEVLKSKRKWKWKYPKTFSLYRIRNNELNDFYISKLFNESILLSKILLYAHFLIFTIKFDYGHK